MTKIARQGSSVVREHPEANLLAKLDKCDDMVDTFNLCLWVLAELGYNDFVAAVEDKWDNYSLGKATNNDD